MTFVLHALLLRPCWQWKSIVISNFNGCVVGNSASQMAVLQIPYAQSFDPVPMNPAPH